MENIFVNSIVDGYIRGNRDRPPAKSFDLNELKIRGLVKRMGPTMFLLMGNIVGPIDTCKNVG